MTNIIQYFGEDLDLDTLTCEKTQDGTCYKNSKNNTIVFIPDYGKCIYNYKYNENGFKTEYKLSSSFWSKTESDKYSYFLAYEDSDGDWYKFTRDTESNLLTMEDECGFITYLTGDVYYGLYYEDGHYKAGCRCFTYEEAIKHWTVRSSHSDNIVKNRAIKFLEAIEKHHQSLKGE